MHLDLHGHGLAGQILGQEVLGEGDVAFGLAAQLDGLDQLFKIFQGLLFAQGQVETLSLDAFQGLAVLVGAEVDVGHLAVHGRAVTVHGHQLGAVAADALHHFFHFSVVHDGLFLLHFHAFIGGQVKGGQHFELDAVIHALAAFHDRLAVHHADAGDGGHVQLGHHFIDVHVDEVLAGFFVDAVAEALFDDGSGHLALAETVNLHRRLVQGDSAHDGGFHFLGISGDGNLFLDRGQIFNSIFHEALL